MDKKQELKLREKELLDNAKQEANKVKNALTNLENNFKSDGLENIKRVDESLLEMANVLDLKLRDTSNFFRGLRFDVVDKDNNYHWAQSVMELTYEPKGMMGDKVLNLDEALSINYGSGGWEKGTTAVDILKAQRFANLMMSSICEKIYSNRNEIDNKIEEIITLDKNANKAFSVLNETRKEIEEINRVEGEKPVYELLSDNKIDNESAQNLLNILEGKLSSDSPYSSEEFSYYTLSIPKSDEKRSYVGVAKHTIEGSIDAKGALRFKYSTKHPLFLGGRRVEDEKRIKKGDIVEKVASINSFSTGAEILSEMFDKRERLTRNEFIELAENKLDVKNKKDFIKELEKNGIKRNRA